MAKNEVYLGIIKLVRSFVMAVVIRLARVGKKNQPIYRIVAIDKRKKRDGANIEILGTFNPSVKPASITVKRERLDYWRSCGAQISEAVKKILAKA